MDPMNPTARPSALRVCARGDAIAARRSVACRTTDAAVWEAPPRLGDRDSANRGKPATAHHGASVAQLV